MHWTHHLSELLTQGTYRTQADLVRALESRTGRALNQATVSRELTQRGIRKVEGIYRLPPSPLLGAPVHSVAVTHEGSLVVVKTDAAFASVLGQAIDDAELGGVLGTIAGDDVVFVALAEPSALPSLCRLLGRQPEARRAS